MKLCKTPPPLPLFSCSKQSQHPHHHAPLPSALRVAHVPCHMRTSPLLESPPPAVSRFRFPSLSSYTGSLVFTPITLLPPVSSLAALAVSESYAGTHLPSRPSCFSLLLLVSLARAPKQPPSTYPNINTPPRLSHSIRSNAPHIPQRPRTPHRLSQPRLYHAASLRDALPVVSVLCKQFHYFELRRCGGPRRRTGSRSAG